MKYQQPKLPCLQRKRPTNQETTNNSMFQNSSPYAKSKQNEKSDLQQNQATDPSPTH
jgi:hypothetical protein